LSTSHVVAATGLTIASNHDCSTKLVLDAEGGDGDNQRVWVHLHEVPDGNWGAVGQVIQFAQLREAAIQAREARRTGGVAAPVELVRVLAQVAPVSMGFEELGPVQLAGRAAAKPVRAA
jgi:hypothetical protein